MATRIDGQGMPEIIERRTRNSKSFQLPGGQIRVVNALYPVHWDNAGTWEEVDETLVTNDGGVTWQTTNTPYLLRWESDTLTLTYRSKKGGDTCRIRLLRLDGVPVVTPAPLPTVTGRSISAFVAPDLEIELRVRSHGVEIFKILHGPLAPTNLTWGVQVGDASKLRFDLMNTQGRDNILLAAATRPIGLNRVRRIEMTHSRTPDDFVTVPGRNTYEVTETFTGRTRFIDPVTSARSWVNEVEYPVEIDVTITELIPAAGDDGGTSGGLWYIANTVHKAAYHSAFRFTTVNVPQGQTLDSATFTWNVTLRSGTSSATMAGEAVDSAAAWANASANDPATMSKTTATVSVAVPAATGLQNIDVKGPVQEIINRATFAANNNVRLAFTDTSAMGADYAIFESYEAVGTQEPKLVIVYTPAAGGASAPNVRPLLITLGRQGGKIAKPWALQSFLPSPAPYVPPVPPTIAPILARFQQRFGRQPMGRVLPKDSAAKAAYTFSADPGTYTLTGQAATLLAARFVSATAGVYTLTGKAASLLRGYALNASKGTYTLSGVAATLLVARAMNAAAGSYAITGRAAATLKGYSVGATAGAYVLTGIDAQLIYSASPTAYVMSAGAGAYALSGKASTLDYAQNSGVDGGLITTRKRKPQRQRPPVYRHPEEIERERRMLEEYLESLETKARPASEEPVRPGESQDAPTRRAEPVAPRLSDVMARLASAQQLELIARAESAAKADKAKAKKEHQRRRVAAIAVLMMGH